MSFSSTHHLPCEDGFPSGKDDTRGMRNRGRTHASSSTSGEGFEAADFTRKRGGLGPRKRTSSLPPPPSPPLPRRPPPPRARQSAAADEKDKEAAILTSPLGADRLNIHFLTTSAPRARSSRASSPPLLRTSPGLMDGPRRPELRTCPLHL